MPRAFITGATGFLGSHIADVLIERGWEVAALARKTSSMRWLEGKKINVIHGDLTDVEALKSGAEGAAAVFHSAAVLKAGDYEGYRKVNVEGTRALFEACLAARRRPSKVVHVSSIAAVGPAFSAEKPISDEDECHPVSNYGRSKREAEKAALSYGDRIPVAVVRPPALYGPRDAQMLEAFKLAKFRLKPQLGFGRRMLNLCHGRDIAEGAVLAAEKEASTGQTFVLGDSKNYEWGKVLDLLLKVEGRRGVSIRVPLFAAYAAAAVVSPIAGLLGGDSSFTVEKAREMGFRYWTCDITKARRLLGYEPKVPLDQGLAETARWYRENGWMK